MRMPSNSPAGVRLAARLGVLLALLATLLAACGASGGSTPTPAPPAIATPETAVAAVQAQVPLFDTFGPVNPDMIGQDQSWGRPSRWTGTESPHGLDGQVHRGLG